jgi:hypothetical protein
VETVDLRLGDALTQLAHELVACTAADACVLSRVVGDVLIITRTVSADAVLDLGQGYLVSDYPATADVLSSGRPACLTVEDDDVDSKEAELLRDLGFSTLLMLPFDVAGERWGLAELYRHDVRPFTGAEIDAARAAAHIG